MTTAADRPSSPRYFSNRPPISFSSYCFNSTTGLMHRSLGKCYSISFTCWLLFERIASMRNNRKRISMCVLMFIFDCMYYYQLNLDCCWDIYTKSKFVLWQLFISDKSIPLQKVQFTYESIIRNSNVLFNTRALNPRLIYIYFFSFSTFELFGRNIFFIPCVYMSVRLSISSSSFLSLCILYSLHMVWLSVLSFDAS
jgi:hypothetical protein